MAPWTQAFIMIFRLCILKGTSGSSQPPAPPAHPTASSFQILPVCSQNTCIASGSFAGLFPGGSKGYMSVDHARRFASSASVILRQRLPVACRDPQTGVPQICYLNYSRYLRPSDEFIENDPN